MSARLSRLGFIKMAGAAGAALASLGGSVGPNRIGAPEGEPGVLPTDLPLPELASDNYQLVALSVPQEFVAYPQVTAESLQAVGGLLEKLWLRKGELGAAGILPLQPDVYGVHFNLIQRYPAETIPQPEEVGQRLVFSLEQGRRQEGQFLGGAELLVPVNLVEGYPPTYFAPMSKSNLPDSFNLQKDALVANPKGGNVIFLYDQGAQGFTHIWESNGHGPYPLRAEFRPVGRYFDQNAQTWIPRLSLDAARGGVITGRDLESFYEGVVMYRYGTDEGYFFVELSGNNAVTLNPEITRNAAITHRLDVGGQLVDVMLKIPEPVDYRNMVVRRDGFAQTAVYGVARIDSSGKLQTLRRYRANVNEDNLSASFLEAVS